MGGDAHVMGKFNFEDIESWDINLGPPIDNDMMNRLIANHTKRRAEADQKAFDDYREQLIEFEDYRQMLIARLT